MGKRILLVDDDPADIKAMRGPLSKEGYSVTVTHSSRDALKKAEHTRFNLILINITMPTISGYELAMLLSDIIPRSTKIAFTSILPKEEAEKTHVDGYIQKPFSPETIVKGVKKLLMAKGSRKRQER